MKYSNSSRRRVLKQFASMTALGAVSLLRSPGVLSATSDKAKDKKIDNFSGNVVHRQDGNYEEWRQSMHWHHSKPSRYPDSIVQAHSEKDVIAAVKHAAHHGLKISVHNTGHNAMGSSLRNGGMLLDVGSMAEIEIDENKQIASIQPGVRSIQLMAAARSKGLSFPTPHCPTVGLSGFTMGGGQGWNWGSNEGMACFSILAADIVTADGQLRHASADENPDLYWAVRGAGPGFFGVVTRLWLKLHPLPKAIHASNYIIPLDKLDETTAISDQLVNNSLDKRVEFINLLAHSPVAPAGTRAEDAKICFVTAFAFGDSEEESIDLLAPVTTSKLGKLSLHKEEKLAFSYEGLFNKYFSLQVPAGMMARYKVDNVMTDEPAKVLHELADHFRKAPSHHAHVLSAMGLNLKHHDDACFSSIATTYVGCYAIWDDEKDDDANYKWLGDCIPLMEPYNKGHYVNEVEPRFNPNRLRECFSSEAWTRLEQLRSKYDPKGVFHHYLRES
jgi:FAD/FMN-containing dehydrogenase